MKILVPWGAQFGHWKAGSNLIQHTNLTLLVFLKTLITLGVFH